MRLATTTIILCAVPLALACGSTKHNFGGAGGGGGQAGNATAGAGDANTVGGTNQGGNDTSGDGGNVGGSGGKSGAAGADGGGMSGADAAGAATGGAGGSATNPCVPDPCVHGTCSASGSSSTCQCAADYTGASCELPRFQPLPFSVGANVFEGAEDISADGSTAVGEATDYGSINRVFRWTAAGGVEDLTSFLTSFLTSGSFFYLSGVSADGSVLAGFDGAGAFRWPAGSTPATAPTPIGYAGCDQIGVKLSADGTVLVGACANPSRAVRWRQVGNTLSPEVLPVSAATTFSTATGVNSDGTIVVGSADVDGTVLHGVRWTTTGMDTIPFLPGCTYGKALGVSANGLVVVGYVATTSSNIAIRWTQSGGTEALPTPATAANTFAQDASEDGAVIVGIDLVRVEPLLWDITGVHYVRDLLIAAGVSSATLQDWKLGPANAVSADGKIIFGSGTNPNGFQEAWIARLP